MSLAFNLYVIVLKLACCCNAVRYKYWLTRITAMGVIFNMSNFLGFENAMLCKMAIVFYLLLQQ